MFCPLHPSGREAITKMPPCFRFQRARGRGRARGRFVFFFKLEIGQGHAHAHGHVGNGKDIGKSNNAHGHKKGG